MRILFDQAVPVPLREFLPGHEVSTALELGWSALGNAEFLAMAAREFDVLVRTDRDLVHRIQPGALRLALLLLPTSSWPRIREHTERIAMAAVSFGSARCNQLRF